MSGAETTGMVMMGDEEKVPRCPRDSAEPEGGNVPGRRQISVKVLGMRRYDKQAKKCFKFSSMVVPVGGRGVCVGNITGKKTRNF